MAKYHTIALHSSLCV